MSRLDVQIAGNRIVMVGRLDDSFSHGELAARIPAGDVVIDTAAITFVNSIGMREWLRLVRVLRERGSIVLERVADVLLVQINMMGGLAAGVTVTSFHAPYVCPACGAESAPLVDAALHAQQLRALEAPRLPCPECGAAMELGDFPERYLSIFKSP